MVALSGPSWREDPQSPSIDNQARVLVVDMSYAMNATDILPSRFQQAFYKTTDLVSSFKLGYTGVVAYTDQGFTISPLTHDKNTVLTQLQYLSPEIMPSQGKNAATGIKEAIQLLTQANIVFGDIVLVTSGISEREQQTIQHLLKNSHFRLSVLAVATTKGATFIDNDGALVRDNNGSAFRSTLDSNRLSQLVKRVRGIYVDYDATDKDITLLHQFIADHKGQDPKASHMPVAVPLLNDGYWLIWPLAVLVLFGFRRGMLFSAAIVCVLPFDNAHATFWRNDDRQGYEAFLIKDYDEAVMSFSDHRWRGVALYENGDYEGAVEAFLKVDEPENDYNLANALAKLGQYERAAELYRTVLARDSKHESATANLNVVEAAIDKQLEQSTEEQEQDNAEGNSEQQESGDSEGSEEREDDSGEDGEDQSDDSSQEQGENDDSHEGASSASSNSAEPNEQPEQNDVSDELNSQSSGPQQTQNEAGDYVADIFGTGSIDDDFGTPTEADLQAIEHQLAELGEIDPVINRLSQIKVDPSLLLRNQLILQAQDKPPSSPNTIEW
jgi:Ca-activated chloride channel family protein